MRKRLLCEQRGAIAILAGLSLVFVITSAALAVDIGQAAWQKRSLQRLVDVVSLDAVRAVGDRKDSVNCVSFATTLAQESATRNDFDYDDTALGNSMIVETGVADAATKAFTPSVDCAAANAVRVTATSRSDNRFMPGNIGLTTQAVAMSGALATFSLGSRAASVDATTSPILNSLLGNMLGGTISLDAVSYNGLLGASVGLGDVWTELGLGTPTQILNSDVTYRDFLNASADALNNQGDPSSVAAATVLGTLATQVGTGAHFKFGDMLAIASGDPGDAANAQMNVLEMIGMAASVANGTNLLNLTLPITIPGVSSTTMKMSVIEPPVIATGPVGTQAHTAQARIQLDLTLVQRLTVLLQQGIVHLPVYVEAAGADGTLTNIRCATPATNSDITVHTVTNAVTAKVGTATDASLIDSSIPADVRDAEIVNLTNLVRVTGSATASMPAGVTDLLIPLYQYRSAGSSSTALDDQLLASLALNVQVLGLGINATTVANNTLAILNPVLGVLDSTLLTTLKRVVSYLGIAIGGADVGNLDTHCDARRLIG